MKGKIWLLYAIFSSVPIIIYQGINQQPFNIGACVLLVLIGWDSACFLIKNRPSLLSLNSQKASSEEKQ